MSEHFFKPETWEPLNEKVVRVGSLAGSLLDFSAALQARSRLTLKEMLAEYPGFASAMLGGVSKDGAYGESSLAGVFRGLFGASIDTRKYCALKATPGEDAEASVNLQVEMTRFEQYSTGPGDFRALLRTAHPLAEQSLKAWERGLSSRMAQGNGESYLHQPIKAVEDTQAFLQVLADLSTGVDERATFLWMTRCITWRYLAASFPAVKEPTGLTFLQQKLGSERLWEPNLNPEGGYTLWGYPDDRSWTRDNFRAGVNTVTYGGSILGLSRLAWLVFAGQTGSAHTWYDIASAVLASPLNLAHLFRERAEGQLMRVKSPVCPLKDEDAEDVEISGPLAVAYTYSSTGKTRYEEKVPLLNFLDWLIPSVCYGKRGLTVKGSKLSIPLVRF